MATKQQKEIARRMGVKLPKKKKSIGKFLKETGKEFIEEIGKPSKFIKNIRSIRKSPKEFKKTKEKIRRFKEDQPLRRKQEAIRKTFTNPVTPRQQKIRRKQLDLRLKKRKKGTTIKIG